MYTSNAVNLRFISWNIYSRKEVLPLLKELDGHLVALQYVTKKRYQEIADSGFFSWSAFSLNLRQPFEEGLDERKWETAIFGRPPFELKRAFLLDDAPWPERGLFADVDTPAGPLTISSFHVPNASNHGDIKLKSFLALAQWLANRPKRMIVGIDTNSPKIDHPDIEQNEWYYPAVEPQMLGPRPLHALKDAFRVWLEAHPQEAEKLYASRPQGPLANTHYQVRGKIGDPDRTENAYRYDYVYISSDISVAQIDHAYNGVPQAFKHAAVVADLIFTPGKSK